MRAPVRGRRTRRRSLFSIACLVAIAAAVGVHAEGEPAPVATLLAQAIRIESVNPPGGETPVARLLARALEDRGIEAIVLEGAPGRGNVVARLPATEPDGRAPLLLLAHLDVVPADPSAWSFAPFSGDIRDGAVWGRGALDDKAHAAVFVEALGLLAASGAPRGRDLVFAGTAGEEVDGAGAQWLIEHHWERLGPPAAVWNEGGASTALPEAGGRIVNGIATGEKRSLWLTLVAEGEGGHGSMPVANGANERLVRALARIASWEVPARITPSVGMAFRRLGGTMSGLEGFAVARLENPLVRWFAGGALRESRTLNAMVRDTVALTVLDSGIKHNVIPRRAEAKLDVRLLPDTDAASFVADLARVIDDPEVRIQLPERGLPPVIPASPTDHEIFRAIEAATAKELPGSLTLPMQANGATDSLFFRARGVPSYGYFPVLLPAELTASMHGLDERIPLAELDRAVRLTVEALTTLARPESR